MTVYLVMSREFSFIHELFTCLQICISVFPLIQLRTTLIVNMNQRKSIMISYAPIEQSHYGTDHGVERDFP